MVHYSYHIICTNALVRWEGYVYVILYLHIVAESDPYKEQWNNVLNPSIGTESYIKSVLRVDFMLECLMYLSKCLKNIVYDAINTFIQWFVNRIYICTQ